MLVRFDLHKLSSLTLFRHLLAVHALKNALGKYLSLFWYLNCFKSKALNLSL